MQDFLRLSQTQAGWTSKLVSHLDGTIA